MSNCVIFALALFWRRWRRAHRRGHRHGDYLVIRLSRIRWGLFHVLHGRLDRNTGQIKVVSYKPDTADKAGLELMFPGHVARGDAPTEPQDKR